MIHMDQKHLDIVLQVLSEYPYTFYAFGSRVKGTQRKLSDLDLYFIEDIPWNIRAHIDEDFENSDLPFTVDVVDFNTCDEDFKKRMLQHSVLIQKGSNFNEQ